MENRASVPVSEIKLQFANLSERHFGVTPSIAAAYAEAAAVCLERHHASPQKVLLQDRAADRHSIAEWQAPDDRTLAGWANRDDATEFGAYGLALAAVELTRGVVAVRRAETRTGADYYLNSPGAPADDLEASLRLEVSGTDEGNDSVIQSRLRQKLEQATAGTSNLPAIATVVGFAVLKVVTADVT
jgi:hypothetical protein